MAIQDITQIQDTENLEKEVMKIVGLKNWAEIKTSDMESKISKITEYISDVYGLFFKEEDKLNELSDNLEILTAIPNNDYELTDDIIDAIVGINQIVEDEKDAPEEFRMGIKTLLLYILDLLQNES